jgi:uncharacterized protein YbjT (DUF2867 family)
MILITAATGNISTELVKQLLAKGSPLRVISRDQKNKLWEPLFIHLRSQFWNI